MKYSHAARLKRYSALTDCAGIPNELLDLTDRSSARYEVIEQVMDSEQNEESYLVQLQLAGLTEKHDIPRSSPAEAYENIPEMIRKYVCKTIINTWLPSL